MNIDRTLGVVSLVAALTGAGVTYGIMQARLEDARIDIQENRSRMERINGTLHQRITRTDGDVTRLREEALRQLGDMKSELGSLDTKIERNHAETSTRLDAVLDRLDR